MRTLHRFILQEMLATIVVAVGVCAGLLLLGNLLKEVLNLLMSGQATLGLVLRGIGLLLPFIFVFALPMGTLTASLLVFGRLSADQELTAARANGISLLSLAIPVVVLSLALCGVCGWINLDLAPRSRFAYKTLLSELATKKAPSLIPPGRFFTDLPNFVIYFERIEGNEIEEVLFFQLQGGRKILDVQAPRARLEFDEKTREVRLAFFGGRYLQWIPGQTWKPPTATSESPAAVRSEGGKSSESGTPGSTGLPEVRRQMPAEDEIFYVVAPAPDIPFLGTNAGERAMSELGISDLGIGMPSYGPGFLTNPTATSMMEPRVPWAPGSLAKVPVTNTPPLAEASAPRVVGGAVTAEARNEGGSESVENSEEQGFWQPIPSKELRASLTLPTAAVSVGLPALSDMTFRQLLEERKELRRLGVDEVTPLDVQLHRQVAFSFACFGFALVGIPLGVRAHRRETSVGIAFAIGLGMVYYAFLILAQAFDTRSEWLPWLIVWMPNALFQGMGAWLLWRANRGS